MTTTSDERGTPLNLNALVRFKPTAKGLAELRRQAEALAASVPTEARDGIERANRVELEPDGDGHLSLPLWELMRRLGPLMGHGGEPPIDMTIVV